MVKKKKRAKKARRGKWLKRLVRRSVKKAKTRKKPAKKVRKKAVRKKSKKEDKFVVGFEEVIIKCSSCGREFRIVKSEGFSAEGMLCQRCAAGGGVGLEGDDDF